MTVPTLQESAIKALAYIRAIGVEQLQGQVDENGAHSIGMTSLEAVAVLVELEPSTGVDPEDPTILDGCGDVTSLHALLVLLTSAQGE